MLKKIKHPSLLPLISYFSTRQVSEACIARVQMDIISHMDILKIVKLYGPISAKGVAERYCTNNTIMTSRTAANILKLFRARGIVEWIEPPIENLSSPTTYKIKTDIPLGIIVKDKIKLKS